MRVTLAACWACGLAAQCSVYLSSSSWGWTLLFGQCIDAEAGGHKAHIFRVMMVFNSYSASHDN